MAQEAHKIPHVWKWSAVVAVAGTTADFATSVGWSEKNSLLSGADGKFDARKGLAIKGGMTGGFLVVQYVLIRKWPKLAKPFAYINFGYGVGYGGLAMSNMARHP